MGPLLPARQVIRSHPAAGVGQIISQSPKLALTLLGAGVGGLWGGLAGAVFGSWKAGALVGGALSGLKGYSHGRDLESWMRESK